MLLFRLTSGIGAQAFGRLSRLGSVGELICSLIEKLDSEAIGLQTCRCCGKSGVEPCPRAAAALLWRVPRGAAIRVTHWLWLGARARLANFPQHVSEWSE